MCIRDSRKADNYKRLVAELLQNYRKFEYTISPKIYFLDSNLDFSLTILAPLVMNIVEAFTRKYPPRKYATRENGARKC